MSTPTTEQLLGGGGQAAKFEAPGDTYEGTIIDKDVQHQTDFKTGEKLFYSRSGNPMWQIIATVETNIHEDADDDGIRRIFFKSGLLTALKQTLKEQKLKDIEVGGWVRAIFTGLGVAEGGGNAPKLYQVEYRSPSANVIAGGNGMQQAQANVQAGLGGQPVQQQPTYAPQQAQQYPAQPVVQQSYTVPQQYQTQLPATTQPTPEMVAGVIAAGMDPKQVWPGYQG